MCLDTVDPDIRNQVVAEVPAENQAKDVLKMLREHIPSPYFASRLNMFTIVHNLEYICYCVASIKCK